MQDPKTRCKSQDSAAWYSRHAAKTLLVTGRQQWRAWLEEHHDSETEIWLVFYKQHTGRPSIAFQDALDEALCFGWIDGVRRSLADGSFTSRFTPRRPRSTWSAVNIARVEELIALGLMQPAGLAAFAKRDEVRSRIYAYEQRPTDFDNASLQQFRANAEAWAFFQAQAPWYQRTAAYWVLSAKKEVSRRSRLATLIADSQASRRIAPLSYGPKPLDPSS
jgi:uncharacterized protein YdeI (YjbR/CyaY-like superfamily)